MTKFENEKFSLEIVYDSCEESPREFSEYDTKMICFHKRYSIGDKHDYNANDFSSWEELEAHIIKKENAIAFLPIYMYEHGGVTISSKDFNDRWDSGRIGIILISVENAKERYGIKRMSKRWKDTIIDVLTKTLQAEIEEYDKYLTGECYGYKLYNEETGEEDQLFGFYGDNIWENGIADNLPDVVVFSLYEQLKEEYGANERIEKLIAEKSITNPQMSI